MLDPEAAEHLRDYLIEQVKKLPQEDLPELAHTIEEMKEAYVRRIIVIHEQKHPF